MLAYWIAFFLRTDSDLLGKACQVQAAKVAVNEAENRATNTHLHKSAVVSSALDMKNYDPTKRMKQMRCQRLTASQCNWMFKMGFQDIPWDLQKTRMWWVLNMIYVECSLSNLELPSVWLIVEARSPVYQWHIVPINKLWTWDEIPIIMSWYLRPLSATMPCFMATNQLQILMSQLYALFLNTTALVQSSYISRNHFFICEISYLLHDNVHKYVDIYLLLKSMGIVSLASWFYPIIFL